MSDPSLKRPHARLIDHFDASVNELQRQVDKRRSALSATLRFPLGGPSSRREGGERPAKGSRASGAAPKPAKAAKAGTAPKAAKASKPAKAPKPAKASKPAKGGGKAARGPAPRRPKRPAARAAR